MRLGSTMYFVPFFFVLNPALILRGEPLDIVVVVVTAVLGIGLIASALEGYLVGLRPAGRGRGRLGRRGCCCSPAAWRWRCPAAATWGCRTCSCRWPGWGWRWLACCGHVRCAAPAWCRRASGRAAGSRRAQPVAGPA